VLLTSFFPTIWWSVRLCRIHWLFPSPTANSSNMKSEICMAFYSTLALDCWEMLVGLQNGTWQTSNWLKPSFPRPVGSDLCLAGSNLDYTQLCTDGVYKATDSTIWFQHLGGRPGKEWRDEEISWEPLCTFPEKQCATPKNIWVGDLEIMITTSTHLWNSDSIISFIHSHWTATNSPTLLGGVHDSFLNQTTSY